MSTATEQTLASARKVLAHYLSDVFRVRFYFPDSLGRLLDVEEDGDEDYSFADFIELLPLVRQKAINGKTQDFFLPLVSKQIHLTPQVVEVINSMLIDERLKPFEVPTFFYPDGSTMVINFDPTALSKAIGILVNHPEYAGCLLPEPRGGT